MAIEPMTMFAAGAGISALGGLLGNVFSSGSRQDALNASRRALDELLSLGYPPDLAKEIILEKYQEVGRYIPDLEEEIQLAAPEVSQIQEAPEFREAQMTALQMLGERAKTGFGAEERAGLAQIQLQQARDTEAKRQQILQSFQQRGMGGAGAELAAQLQAASAGSAQAGEEGLRLQAQAAQNVLQAASMSGTLGGQIRGQEFDIARTKAGAKDQANMARFNQALARQERNVASMNLAQQQNLATQQRISEQNVALRNRELYRQREAQDQQYRLAMARTGMISQGYQNMANVHQGQAAQTAGAWTGGAGAIGQGLVAGGTYLAGQQSKTPKTTV